MLIDIKARVAKPPFSSVQVDWGHPLAYGLSVCWPFLEGGGRGVRDLANRQNGTGEGTGSPRWVPIPRWGISGNFNGTDDRINVPTSPLLQGFGKASFVVFVQPASIAADQTLLTKQVSLTADTNPFQLYTLFIAATTGRPGFGLSTGAAGSRILVNGTTTAFSPNVATVYIATWDGATMRIFLNGVQDATTGSFSGPVGTNTNPTYVGTYDSGNTKQYLSGKIALAAIYSRDLKFGEVLALTNEPYAFLQPVPAMRYWSTPPATVTPASGTHVLYLGRAA